MKKIILLMMMAAMTLAAGCSTGDKEGKIDKITVVVSVVPEATFVEAVAGDLVDIVTLIPPGNSPANYLPTTKEMQAISDADIYFVMQVPTEEANILPKIADFNEDIIMVNLRDAVSAEYPLRHILGHDHGDEEETAEDEHTDDEHAEEESVDPHIWLSPRRVIVMVNTIAEELSKLDEENAEIYSANAKKYIEELQSLDSEIDAMVAGLENKTFMIYHGSYGYFADDYGLNMVSLESDGKAATAVKMQEVIDLALEQDIKSIFYQDEFADTQARTIAEEIGGTVMRAAPLSADYIKELRDFAAALSDNGE
ncbi:MAG: zinc ABC transporter substrate-binding protein [Clostridia bacterium]|nr:zinc ABC transporter substrate-binding protein [Clostridia bacterium]